MIRNYTDNNISNYENIKDRIKYIANEIPRLKADVSVIDYNLSLLPPGFNTAPIQHSRDPLVNQLAAITRNGAELQRKSKEDALKKILKLQSEMTNLLNTVSSEQIESRVQKIEEEIIELENESRRLYAIINGIPGHAAYGRFRGQLAQNSARRAMSGQIGEKTILEKEMEALKEHQNKQQTLPPLAQVQQLSQDNVDTTPLVLPSARKKNNVVATQPDDKDLQSQLIGACEQGNLSAVQAAIDEGANPILANNEGKLPLAAAVWGMNPEVVKFLLNLQTSNMTLLECQEHNNKHYNEIFIVEKFAFTTYQEWYDLLMKIRNFKFIRETFVRIYNYKMKTQILWDDLESTIRGKIGAGQIITQSSDENCVNKTNDKVKKFRDQVINLIEPAYVVIVNDVEEFKKAIEEDNYELAKMHVEQEIDPSALVNTPTGDSSLFTLILKKNTEKWDEIAGLMLVIDRLRDQPLVDLKEIYAYADAFNDKAVLDRIRRGYEKAIQGLGAVDTISVPQKLLNSTYVLAKQSERKVLKARFKEFYEALYNHQDLKNILDLASFLTYFIGNEAIQKTQTGYRKQLAEKQLKIYADPNSNYVENIFFVDSETSVLGLQVAQQVYIGLKNFNVDSEKSELISTLIHELTHFIAREIYGNGATPYEPNDAQTQAKLDKICKEIKTKAAGTSFQGLYGYEKEKRHGELIARTAEYLWQNNNPTDKMKARNMLKAFSPDLYYFYFHVFLKDCIEHYEELVEAYAACSMEREDLISRKIAEKDQAIAELERQLNANDGKHRWEISVLKFDNYILKASKTDLERQIKESKRLKEAIITDKSTIDAEIKKGEPIGLNGKTKVELIEYILSLEAMIKKMRSPSLVSSIYNTNTNTNTNWYSDDDINQLLNKTLRDNTDTYYLDAMLGTDSDAGNTLSEQLSQYLQERQRRTDNKEKVVISVNLNNSHWVLLYLKFSGNNSQQPNQIFYIDPFGQKMSEAIEKNIKSKFPQVNIDSSQVQLQQDGYNCGPWILAAAKFLVEQKHINDVSIVMKHLQDLDIQSLRNDYDQLLTQELQPNQSGNINQNSNSTQTSINTQNARSPSQQSDKVSQQALPIAGAFASTSANNINLPAINQRQTVSVSAPPPPLFL